MEGKWKEREERGREGGEGKKREGKEGEGKGACRDEGPLTKILITPLRRIQNELIAYRD